MRDSDIDPPSDFPKVNYREHLVSGDNPTPSFPKGVGSSSLVKFAFLSAWDYLDAKLNIIAANILDRLDLKMQLLTKLERASFQTTKK